MLGEWVGESHRKAAGRLGKRGAGLTCCAGVLGDNGGAALVQE
jgi:hypothetical protein